MAAGGQLLRPRLGTLVAVRWFGVLFAVVQVAAYDTMPPPDWVASAGYAVAAGLGVANLVLWAAVTRVPVERLQALAVANIVVDLVAISALVWIYSFDPVSALFTALILVPIEGALLFGLPGAVLAWVGAAVSYTGREWFATRFDNPWETGSVTFRVGIIGFVAVVVGLMARDLQRQRDAADAALEERRRADAWRGRVVAMLAHDLRSPLAAVRMTFDMLARDQQLDEDTRTELSERGRRRVDQLLTLTADLLDVARSEEGRLELAREPTPFAEVVADAIRVAGADESDLEVHVPDDLVVDLDPDRFRQILTNLVANAVRHGSPPVEVWASRQGGEVLVEVRDHGEGMPEELRDRMFEPFLVGSDEASVGLGIWLVAELVRAHGGTVAHEDAGPGARFVIRLPDPAA